MERTALRSVDCEGGDESEDEGAECSEEDELYICSLSTYGCGRLDLPAAKRGALRPDVDHPNRGPALFF
eukprot:8099302-Pyramimonas_sp.AAC.2